MACLRTRRRNNGQDTSMHTDPDHCTDTVENAVPLLSPASNCDYSISGETNHHHECEQPEEGGSLLEPILMPWNLHYIFIVEVATGVLIRGISVGASEMWCAMQSTPPPENQQTSGGTNIISWGHAMQYAILFFLAHLEALIHLLICILGIWVFLSSNGRLCAQKWLERSVETSILVDGQEEEAPTSENDSQLYSNVRAVFVLFVCLNGGYLLGVGFVDLILSTILDVPLTTAVVAIMSAVSLDVIVCCMVVIVCYGTTGIAIVTSRRQNDDEPIVNEDEELLFYAQII